MAAEIPGNGVAYFLLCRHTRYDGGGKSGKKALTRRPSVTSARVPSVGQVGARVGGRGRGRETRTETERETAKITFGFKRRYLGNGKSYRLGTKSVRNGRLPRFLRPRNMRRAGFCSRQVRSFKLWNNFDSFSIAVIGVPRECFLKPKKLMRELIVIRVYIYQTDSFRFIEKKLLS